MRRLALITGLTLDYTGTIVGFGSAFLLLSLSTSDNLILSLSSSVSEQKYSAEHVFFSYNGEKGK